MSQSIYLSIAIFFVRADLNREKRLSERKYRQAMEDIPWNNAHLLRDIGLEPNVSQTEFYLSDDMVSIRIRSICRLISLRSPT